MKRAVLILALIWSASACVALAEVDKAAMVVEWNGGGITVGDFIAWWERMPPAGRPELSTMDEKSEFLESMINAKLMIAAAESLGLDRHPDIVDWVTRRRTGFLMEKLFSQATAGRLGIDEADVDRIYQRRLTQVVARHIIVPTLAEAEAMVDSINAGVPFEDLARRHSTCASAARGGSLGAVRWGDFSDRWSEQAFRLEPGQVSPPFRVETGYGIIKVEGKTLMEPADPEAEKKAIRNKLEKQQIFEEQKVFTDSLRLAYEVQVDVDAIVDLCAAYAAALMELGETRQVIDVDVIPDLTEGEKAKPVVTYDGGAITTGELVGIILSQPYVVRPKLDDPGEMIPLVSRELTDTLLVMEAEKRGLDKLPEIAIPLEKIRQRKLTQYLYRYVTREAEVPEEELRAYFDAHREDYMLPAAHTASKIVVGSREAADSILAMIQAGGDFGEIARERSIDPFSAPQRGDIGMIEQGKDPEFDKFFATMKVGDIKYFRSLEGHMILWLRARRESRLPTFEEAKPEIAEDLLPAYKDKILVDWIQNLRSEKGVTINRAVLDQIAVGS
jgi:peptidyl-prolyl cis-trans isomerase C